jgi:3-oxoacyl-[acyl-carrier protein] reductase
MDLNLKGQTVLITGGSKGIGFAAAERFAREGARVVITGRDAARLASAKQDLGSQTGGAFDTFAGDLSLAPERERLFKAQPDIDILVNNAGAIPGGNLIDLPLQNWIDSWQLKVFGYIHLMQLYLGKMQARRSGVIVNIIGMAGQAPRWDYICGSTANAGLIALTQAAGAKSVDWNVRVFGINPAPTKTDRIEALGRKKARDLYGDEERWPETLKGLPFGRATEPSEIADLTVMLASPRASYLSGVVVDVDGGKMFTG